MKLLRSHNGFTIIEIAAVLVIIAILSTLAVTRLDGLWFSVYRDVDRLVADLRYAQSLAMTRAPDDGEVTVKIEGNRWYLEDNELWFADGKRDSWTVKDSVTITPSIDIKFKYPKGQAEVVGVDADTDPTIITFQHGSNSILINFYHETGYVEIQ